MSTVAELKQQVEGLKQEAVFWQSKYFEQLLHSTQIIAALNRPMLAAQAQQQAAHQAAGEAAKAAQVAEAFGKDEN